MSGSRLSEKREMNLSTQIFCSRSVWSGVVFDFGADRLQSLPAETTVSHFLEPSAIFPNATMKNGIERLQMHSRFELIGESGAY